MKRCNSKCSLSSTISMARFVTLKKAPMSIPIESTLQLGMRRRMHPRLYQADRFHHHQARSHKPLQLPLRSPQPTHS